jgi:hypothetical protein
MGHFLTLILSVLGVSDFLCSFARMHLCNVVYPVLDLIANPN